MKTSIAAGVALVGVLFGLGYLFMTTGEGSPAAGGTSPIITGNCLEVNGVNTCYYSQRFTVGSTTCSIKPIATSTLVSAVARVSSNMLTTGMFEWGRGVSPNATTTSFGVFTLGAGAQGTLIASTTVNVGGVDAVTVIPANTFFNLKIGSSTPTGLTGTCSIVVQNI